MRLTPSSRSWAWGAFWTLALAAAAHASQDGGPKPRGEDEYTFFNVWILGGSFQGFLFVLPIEICSIATVATIIEHFFTLRRDKVVPPPVVVELEALLNEGRHEKAMGLCQASRNYITQIVGAALSRLKDGPETMLEAAAGATDEQNLKLQHKISWLPLFGNIGPLMGLFGTVVGMVIAFTDIAQSDQSPSPKQLAQGIYTALVTTVWGLLVAMPATFFSFIFKMRVQRLSFELSGVALELVEQLKPAATAAGKKA